MMFTRLLVLSVFLVGGPLIQPTFAESSSGDVPPGTFVSQENWQQYSQYMSEGVKALFQGSHFWHLPSDLRIEVEPTVSIPLPHAYREDTARYARQVRLVPTPAGGYVPMGYVAGLPFPDPLDGDPALIGQRVFWDSYYRYQPRVQGALSIAYTLDSLGNETRSSDVLTVLSQLAFISDRIYPRTTPDAGGYFAAKYYEQIAPEQGKYSVELDLASADPTKLDEEYEYIPTLRRSLRLSEAARCAPVFGSDYLIDDENYGPPGLPQLFQIEYLGKKRILVLAHAVGDSFDSAGGARRLNLSFYYPGGFSFVPFPKPAMGKWELRDTYVIALKRLSSASKNYCYSKRVMYVDAETFFGAGELDLYDPAGSLFKAQLVFARPVPIPEGVDDSAILPAGDSVGFIVDFLNRHVTAAVGLNPCVNSGCADDGYLDIHHYASPEALMKVVR
jgi:hypothetical protein